MLRGPMPIEKHIKNANDLAAACHYLTKIVNRCNKYYPVTRIVMRALKFLSPLNENSHFCKLQIDFNKQYKRDINKKDLQPDEEIYKNLNMRYKKLKR